MHAPSERMYAAGLECESQPQKLRKALSVKLYYPGCFCFLASQIREERALTHTKIRQRCRKNETLRYPSSAQSSSASLMSLFQDHRSRDSSVTEIFFINRNLHQRKHKLSHSELIDLCGKRYTAFDRFIADVEHG